MPEQGDAMSDNAKVLLCGWYGASNIGDELLLGGVLDWLAEASADATIISLNPAHTQQVYGVPAVDFHNLGAIAQALAVSDVFIMGGGGIFQDHHPFNISALYDPLKPDIAQYARPFYMARQFGLETIILAHGVGPLRSRQAQQIVRDVFTQASAVSVRDQQSADLLCAIGVEREIVIAPDPGWQAALHVLQSTQISSPPVDASTRNLGLIIREWPSEEGWSDKLVDALNRELPDNWRCTWLAFQHALDEQRATSDRPYIEQLSTILDDRIQDEIIDCTAVSEMTSVLAGCDAIVSMRLHGSILAISLGMPCVFLEYDDKMTNAHKMAGVPDELRMSLKASAEEFCVLIRRLVHITEEKSAWEISPDTVEQLQQGVLRHKQLLINLLSSRSTDDRSKPWQSSRDFDWMGAWMQDLIWQNKEVGRTSDRAHALLRYRDSQLSEFAVKTDILNSELAQLKVQLGHCPATEASLKAPVQSIDTPPVVEAESILREKLMEERCTVLHKRLKRASAKVEDQAARISRLRQEKNVQNSYILKKEIHIATLERTLQQLNRSQGSKMSEVLGSISPKIRRAIYLLQNGGPRALLSAIKTRRMIQNSTHTVPVMSVLSTSLADHAQQYFEAAAKLRQEELVIFSAHSYRQLGGLHRAAELAKAAIHAGHRVIYVSLDGADLETNVPGLLNLALEDLTTGRLFAQISEHAVMLYLHSESALVPFAQYAHDRGLKSVFDCSFLEVDSEHFELPNFTNICELVDTICVSDLSLVPGIEDRHTSKIMELSEAANHTFFDIYKQYPRPDEWAAETRPIALLFSQNGHTHWVDWKYLYTCAELNPDAAFYVLGAQQIPTGAPHNVGALPEYCMERANQYVANADILIAPVKDNVETFSAIGGIYAGLFLNKTIICSKQAILDAARITHEAIPVALPFAELGSRPHPNNDLLVASNSWLSRLESLVPVDARQDVSVVILIHNNAKIIGRCLQTLLLHCTPYIREVIVVDNASSDGGAEIVERDFPTVRLIRNPENGCSSGRNLGVQHATGKYITFFDSDQWFTGSSGFVEALSILEKNANVGVIGWNAGWFDATRTDLGGMIADYCPNRAMNANAIRNGYRSDIGFLGTSGFFMRRATFDAIEGFDTFYDPTCFEDTDLCFQVRALDMEVSFRDLSGVRHQPHQTTGADSGSDRYKQLFLRNANYFKEKWKNYPEFFLDYNL